MAARPVLHEMSDEELVGLVEHSIVLSNSLQPHVSQGNHTLGFSGRSHPQEAPTRYRASPPATLMIPQGG